MQGLPTEHGEDIVSQLEKMLIVGSGPAGLTAAIYGARAGLNPLVLTGLQHGGQLTTTTEIENFPGFEHGIAGPALMNNMAAQAARVGARIVHQQVQRVDLQRVPYRIWTDEQEVSCKTLIIATGATAKTLGLPRESELMGRGLSTCATCDGFFYKGKTVAVSGGGDSAMEEANYLANLAKKVYLVHRRDVFRASPIMLDRARKNPKIEFKVPYEILDTVSDAQGLTGLKLKRTDVGSTEEITVDGLFMAIGHRPNSEVFRPFVETDEQGYIRTRRSVETNIPGVFAAGDIADSVFRQAITAAGLGCQAAILAYRYLEGHGS